MRLLSLRASRPRDRSCSRSCSLQSPRPQRLRARGLVADGSRSAPCTRGRCSRQRAARGGYSQLDSTVGFARDFSSPLLLVQVHSPRRVRIATIATRVHVQRACLISGMLGSPCEHGCSCSCFAAVGPSVCRLRTNVAKCRGCSRSCSMPRDLACGLLLRCSRPSGDRATVRAFAEGDLSGDPPRHTFRSRSGSGGVAAASASRG